MTAIFYTVVGSLPLFLVSAHAERLQSDLGFGTAELGYAVTSYCVAAAAGSMFLGPLVDRLGTLVGFRMACLGSAAGTLAMGWLAASWIGVAVCLALSGLASTLVQLTCNRLLARQLAVRSQGFGFAAKQAAVPLASLLAGLVVWLTGTEAPWRVTFLGFAGVALVAAALSPGSSSPHSRSPSLRLRLGVATLPLLALALTAGLGSAASNSLSVLAVDAFADSGFSEGAAARLLGLGSAASLAVRLVVGWDVDRRRSRGLSELTLLMGTGAAGFLLMAGAGGSRPAFYLGVLLSFAAGWAWPAVIYFAAARNSNIEPATATSFVVFAVYAGMVVGPLLLAQIGGRVGYPIAWAVGGAMMAAAAVMAQVSRRLFGRPCD